MTTETKPHTGSYTAYKREQLAKVEGSMQSKAELTAEAYSELMFNIGDRFAQEFSRQFLERDNIYDKLMLDGGFDFWSWWRLKFKLDDIALIDYDALDYDPYNVLKEAMIGDELLTKELFHQIKHLL